ncbi:4-hydroxybenzoyl-CoA thioesterase [Rhodococcus triatomae]|uniref:Acyl-ACP thioesterase n=1 Tax=Rhodococcus triatomae TaxID=300028 RepID=A0A1G8JES8_9NOCA|nr:acyl-ACP thioesterase domain-containing protein [Rhodococcus triatomae]QNG19735.1 4-hydroxybenzoyl-CoA thioesterase [Rhodococcus triatomae]QNG24349.1 4-hydroxybenzoyl-CoA thioesterase [Rhodococcus triatomae]SDI29715.1 Acyl-ACP thioesterase [Rhodococcus triatomae]
MTIEQPLAAVPETAHFYENSWPIRTGDIDATQRLRLDGIARYLQDMGADNLEAIGALETHPLWIVRRTVIDVLKPTDGPERIRLLRWCSGFSTRWADMRVQITAGSGAVIETSGFWINISPETGMPTRMSDRFIERLAESTAEHRLKWKRWITDDLPDAAEPGVTDAPFVLRHTDIDPFDHVNNAVYWQAVEEQLARRAPHLVDVPHRAVVEYLSPIVSTDQIALRSRVDDTALTIWFVVDGAVRATARISSPPNTAGPDPDLS